MRRPRIGPLFEEMHADLFRADYCAHYKTAYVKGMWKMFMRIGQAKI